jgi:glycosyltransferase involved in cell wall biosynthesis
VATIHDLAAFHVAGKYDWMRTLYGRFVAGRLARRQEGLIAVSENTARDMDEFWGIPRGRITVIHNGLDLRRFSSNDIPTARAFCQHRFGVESPFFLYVARLEHPGKNHVRLIEAFTRFKLETELPWQLVLAGSDWHGAEAIHAAVARSAARNYIRCLGFVSDDELPMLYRAAEGFVYPSLHEGFGMPPLEAMASGCPVLCSTRGALGEVVGDAAMIVDPEDTQALTASLTELARNESCRAALRQKGLEHSRQFDWNQAAAKTLEVYSRVARLGSQSSDFPMASLTPRTYRGYAQPSDGIGFRTRFEP